MARPHTAPGVTAPERGMASERRVLPRRSPAAVPAGPPRRGGRPARRGARSLRGPACEGAARTILLAWATATTLRPMGCWLRLSTISSCIGSVSTTIASLTWRLRRGRMTMSSGTTPAYARIPAPFSVRANHRCSPAKVTLLLAAAHPARSPAVPLCSQTTQPAPARRGTHVTQSLAQSGQAPAERESQGETATLSMHAGAVRPGHRLASEPEQELARQRHVCGRGCCTMAARK